MWRFKIEFEFGKVKDEPVSDAQLDTLVERSDPSETLGFGLSSAYSTEYVRQTPLTQKDL